MKQACYIGEDRYLWQKIRIELRGVYDVAFGQKDSAIALFDTRFDGVCPPDALRLGEDLPIPFPLGALKKQLDGAVVRLHGKTASFGQITVRLTDVEASLLRALIEADGAFVSREELIGKVWNGQVGESSLNVYIHYLRNKLEASGEKLILASRSGGYCISRKYLCGEKEAVGSDADAD